jgi:hypothetical protein
MVDKRFIAIAIAVIVLVILSLIPMRTQEPAPQEFFCADGRKVTSLSECPEFQKYICSDGSIVNNPSECPGMCSAAAVGAALRAKLHPSNPSIISSAASALSIFNATSDNESNFFKLQLYKNTMDGSLSPNSASEIEAAIALYRFVRDMSSSSSEPDFDTARSDVDVLASAIARADEKALLLKSLYASKGLSARVVVPADCGGEQCDCILHPRRVLVAVQLKQFDSMQIYPNNYYGGPFDVCQIGDGFILVDPSCRDCIFAYGFNCTGSGFITILPE